MISVLHKSLILLLFALQVVAPLVHAHTGKDVDIKGLHLPGLEQLNSKQSGQILVGLTSTSELGGFLITVDAGIKNSLLFVDQGLELSPIDLPAPHSEPLLVNKSTQQEHASWHDIPIAPLAPRAPPVSLS